MNGRPGQEFVDFSDAAIQVRELTAQEALRGLATVVILAGRVLQALGYPESDIEELMLKTVRMNLAGPVFGRPHAEPAATPCQAIAEGERS